MTDPHMNDQQDDAIIGRAFAWSMGAFAVIAAVIVGAWLLFEGSPRPAPSLEPVLAQTPPVEQPAELPQIPFTEVTTSAGIDFVHRTGARGDRLLPETMGGGCAFLDVDVDGDQDVLLIGGTTWPEDVHSTSAFEPSLALYLNDGLGRFTEATEQCGLARDFYGMGVAVGDIDNDGDPDLFLTAVGRSRLLRNDGGRFMDISEASGISGTQDTWSTSAAFFDLENDGDLDLFVCNYVQWSRRQDLAVSYTLTGLDRAYGPPMNFRGSHCQLFRNDGSGRFVDCSRQAGVQVTNPATGEPMAKALGVVPIDLDSDGWMDLIVANDTVRNFVFLNRGDGTFEEIGARSGLGYTNAGLPTGAMGIDAAELRADGALAVAIGNFANEMTSFYLADRDPLLFYDMAMSSGLGASTRRALTFGLFFFDADLDGRLDLLQANGHIEDRISRVQSGQTYEQAAQLFWNMSADDARAFVQLPDLHIGDLARPIVGRGAAYADIDADGDLDVLLMALGASPMLLRNDQALNHHFVRLKLIGDRANRDAIGARIELVCNGRTLRRRINPTRSYLSQVELPVTIGLGDATQIDSLRITWPGGETQVIEHIPLDTLTIIRQMHSDPARPG